ncbi:hypothetical protein V6Z11_A10G110900 [Gossypium hirsutum]
MLSRQDMASRDHLFCSCRYSPNKNKKKIIGRQYVEALGITEEGSRMVERDPLGHTPVQRQFYFHSLANCLSSLHIPHLRQDRNKWTLFATKRLTTSRTCK